MGEGFNPSDFPPLVQAPVVFPSSTPRNWNKVFGPEPSAPKVLCLSYFPQEPEIVPFSDEKLTKGGEDWNLCLVGYSIGRRPFYEALLGDIKKTWSLKGSVQLLSLSDGFFRLCFSCSEDYEMVWSWGVWFLLGRPFVLQKWHPKFKPQRENFTSVPIWVKIHDLPLACWNSEGISRIASKIGIPLAADNLTEQKTRLTFARVCVLLDNNAVYPEEIKVSLDGDIVSLKVQYEWRPFPCDHWLRQGYPLSPYLFCLAMTPSLTFWMGEILKPWVVLQYHPIDSPLSNKIKQKMAVEVVKNAQFMTRSDYLHSLPSRKLADETVTRASSMRMQKLGKKFSMMIDSQASDSVETKTEHNADSSSKRDGDVIQSLAEQSIPIETHKHIRRGVLEIFNYKTVLSFQSIVSGLQGIACWSPLKNDVKTRLLVNAAALAVSAPEKDLRSVIEQVAVRVHGVYVLKTAGDPALDPLRNVVISLYQAREPNAKLRKKKVKQAAQSCLNIDISDNEYYQVFIPSS
ncbi:uncharacterized protein LOC110115963 isoform X2 [Dendrobium catenatum]|uniref:uncharacterized protein LOC110115963 isoform X2 n=1 Tax=Dendrobium catenatum TaxID=906689 RepID=UPI0010A0150E|nr:uncharacterized protein LOC110115963 isoform X2 [Dendrobium catenatum]